MQTVSGVAVSCPGDHEGHTLNWDKWAPGLRYLKPWEKAVNVLAAFAFIAFIWFFDWMRPHALISHQPIYWIVLGAYLSVVSWLSYRLAALAA